MLRIFLVFLWFSGFCVFVTAKDYLGAEVHSLDSVTYGKWEIRMRTCGGDGFLSKFYLYKNDSWMPGRTWRQIDIEILGRYTDKFQTNIFTGVNEEPVGSQQLNEIMINPSQNFLTYTLVWTPDSICWYVEGVLVRKSVSQQVVDCRDDTMSYRINAWISSNVEWAGSFDSQSLPVYQFVNWVKFYSYTPENENDFSLSWVDEFDSFDTEKWGKSDWTFNENLVDFDPENALISDGMLVLCITRPDSPGFSGTVPLDPGSSSGIIANRIVPAKVMGGSVSKMLIKLDDIELKSSHYNCFTPTGRYVKSCDKSSGVFMYRK